MRPVVRAAAVLVSGVAAIGLVPGTGLAATGGSDGPGGTVTVGVGDGGSGGTGSSSSPGGVGATDGTPGTGPGTGGAGASGGAAGSGWICTYTQLALNNADGTPPGGPTPGSWYSVTCTNQSTGGQVTQTEWIANSTPTPTANPTSAPPPVANPYTVALQAERSMVLPRPRLEFNPSGPAIVNLPTWLWIGDGVWHPFAVTASIGTVSATAVAVPEAVTWSMGDGHTVTCMGPGTPFDTSRPASTQSTGCSHAYLFSSAGQPSPDGNPDHGSFTVQATVTWSVTWTAQGAPGGGVLPSLTTSTTALLPVEQVESVNADPGVASSLAIANGEAAS
jgi:hypothetical protein